MTVESRFVVIRHGVEAKTFMDKKSADEYDKMLDMADNLAEIFVQAPIDITDIISEELSIYLAQHRDEVLVALLAKKATKKVSKKSDSKVAAESTPAQGLDEGIVVKSKGKVNTKLKSTKAKSTKTAQSLS